MKVQQIGKEEGAMTFSGHKCDGDVEFKEGTWELVIPKDCEFKMTINGTGTFWLCMCVCVCVYGR
jgi:hypothetical protein